MNMPRHRLEPTESALRSLPLGDEYEEILDQRAQGRFPELTWTQIGKRGTVLLAGVAVSLALIDVGTRGIDPAPTHPDTSRDSRANP